MRHDLICITGNAFVETVLIGNLFYNNIDQNGNKHSHSMVNAASHIFKLMKGNASLHSVDSLPES